MHEALIMREANRAMVAVGLRCAPEPSPAGGALRWPRWLLACAVCTVYSVCPGGCSRTSEVDACVTAGRNNAPDTAALCETAWQHTQDEAAAVAGARYALRIQDDGSLKRWAERARPTIEGARILHFWGDRQRTLGDLEGAEVTLRRALELRLDRDPERATNTASSLLDLVQSSQPAAESIKLAALVWDQASRSRSPLPRAFAAAALADILIDLGELQTAEAVLRRMDPHDSRALKDITEGHLRAAQGRSKLAVELYRRAGRSRSDPGSSWPLTGRLRLTQALLESGQLAAARTALDEAIEIANAGGTKALDDVCRLHAAEAEVLLAEGRTDQALATADRGLQASSRDAARVLLLNVRGDVLARRGEFAEAERTWRAAADSVESWRASIPSTRMRSGLVVRHRHALESWLESTASRGDVSGALEVVRRMVGRGLLDRIHEREASAPIHVDASASTAPAVVSTGAETDVGASIDDVVRRLEAHRELAATMATTHDLSSVGHDMVAILSGARSMWAIRRVNGQWSIDRVGDRDAILVQADAYRRAIDDPKIAAKLGAAMFPLRTLPTGGAPLVVLLDRELADLALAGLRVGDRYLVEHAPILELLTPELLFAPIPERTWGSPAALGDPNGDLPSAEREVRVVARGLAVEPLLGSEANRNALVNASAARVLHVATHSTGGNGEAALALFDGALSALEIVERRIAPRLAVIATCRSQVDDDPMTSLVAAFLAAGAAGVVGVKRALDDDDGANLMLAFYHSGGADNPVRALAAAQRAAIADHRLPHAWATVSFFGVGGWIRTRSER